MMQVVHTIQQVRQQVSLVRTAGRRIGFVPTMGALHAGHGSLIEKAAVECDFVVVSIFVNPTQFGPTEDLDQYPRTLEADAALCERLGADLVFAPPAEQMYPQEQLSWVVTEQLTEGLCGANRPGHFRGVTTVCSKLFHIVTPDVAYFGQKDAQQAVVIRRMVADLNMPLEICVCPIVREPDGLAMSSRNRYLSADQRQRALSLWQSLEDCRSRLKAGETDGSVLKAGMCQILEKQTDKVDYISIVDPDTLEPVSCVDRPVLVLVAAYVGSTRLIDNLWIDLNTV